MLVVEIKDSLTKRCSVIENQLQQLGTVDNLVNLIIASERSMSHLWQFFDQVE